MGAEFSVLIQKAAVHYSDSVAEKEATTHTHNEAENFDVFSLT